MSDILDDLRAGGRHHSFGTFSLDQKKAQEKMREFQLVDPHEYILHFVAAAVAGGATRVEMQVDGGDLVLQLEGFVLPSEMMQQPLSGLFIAKDRPEMDAWRHFSVALNALFGLKPRAVEVRSGDLQGTIDAHGAVKGGPLDPPQPGTTVHVAGRWTWRRLLPAFGAVSEEEALLRERACWAPIPVRVRGEDIAGAGWLEAATRACTAAGAVEAHGFTEGDVRMLLWVESGGPPLSTRVYVRRGIQVAKVSASLPPLQPAAAVYCDRLLTNASESGVLDDRTLQQVDASLDKAAREMLTRVCQRCLDDETLMAALRPRLLHAASRYLQFDPQWTSPQGRALAALPLFKTLDGGTASLDVLRSRLKRQPLLYMQPSVLLLERPPRASLVVKIESNDELDALKMIFVNKLQPFATPRDFVMRNLGLARWRLASPRRHVVGCVAPVPIDDDGFTGELGLATGDAPTLDVVSELTLLVGGRPLRTRHVDGILRYVALLEHPDMSVNLRWDDVEEDKVYARGLAALTRAYAAACRKQAADVARVPGEAGGRLLREHVLRLLKSAPDSPPEPWVLPIPLVPTVQGSFCSLADLQAEAEARGRLVYVLDAAPGPQMDERLVVSLRTGDQLLDLKILRRLLPHEWKDYSRRLASERLTLQLQSRPHESPTLSSSALFPTSFKRGEIFGWVGLRTDGELSTLTLLRKGRRLQVRPMRLALDPLEAALDSPHLQANAEATEAIDDEALAEAQGAVLDEGCRDLARKVAVAFADTPPGPLRDRLRSFLDDWVRLYHDELTGEIEACPLFRAIDGAPVTLLQIRACVRERQSIRWVPPEEADARPQEWLTLALDERERTALQALFPGQLSSWTAGLRRARTRAAFLERPVVECALPGSEYAFVRSFKDDVLEGLIGVHPPSQESRAGVVRVLYEQRELCTVPISAPLRITALVWSPAIEPTDAFTRLPEDKIAPLVRAVEDALGRMICAHAMDEGIPARERLTLAVMYCIGSVASPVALLTRQEWSAVGQLCKMPMLPLSDGRTATLIDMVRQSLECGYVRWVDADVEGEPLDGIPAFRLDENLVALLRPHFREMQSYTARLEKDAALRADLARTRTVERIGLRGKGPFLVRMKVDDGGWRGELGIAADPGSPGIELVIGRLALDVFDPFPGLGVVGMLTGPFKPARGGTAIDLSPTQRDAIRGLIDRLLMNVGEQPENQALLLRWYLVRKAEWTAGKDLNDGSLTLPVFPMAGGGMASLRDLMWHMRKHRVLLTSCSPMAPPRDERVVVCAPDHPLHAFLTQFFGPWAICPIDAAALPTVEREDRPARPAAPLGPAAATPPTAPGPPTPSPIGAAAPPPPSPIEAAAPPKAPPRPADPARVLLRGAQAAFRAMALKPLYDWRMEVFGRVTCTRAARRKQMVYLDGTLCFNTEHAVAQALIADPENPDHVAMLASALFTVYNQAKEDVTDQDEVRFMAELLAWRARAQEV